MERIETGSPVRVGEHTLVPIEKTIIINEANKDIVWYYGSKRPVALIVQTGAGDQVLLLETDQVSRADRIAIGMLLEGL